MFELITTHEVAQNEKNKLLRYIYTKYTNHKLKTVFFDKFDINKIELNKDLLLEFFQLYNCTYIHEKVNMAINAKYPYVFLAEPLYNTLELRYHGFGIKVEILNDKDFTITVLFNPKKYDSVSLHPDTRMLNESMFSKIILMVIYNYCVAYIYGYNSKLFIDDNKYIGNLYDMYI